MRLPDGQTVAERIDALVLALGDAVGAMGGTVAFAAHLEKPIPEVSRRVHRGDDGKGTRMEPWLIFLAHLDDDALDAFLARWLPTRNRSFAHVRRLTDAERADIMAEAMGDEMKRALEKKRGLVPGSLG